MSKQPASDKKGKKKKKSDPFWPIVIILSILAFTGSFWFFYMLTQKINTRTFNTTDTPKLMVTQSPEISLESGSPYYIGDNKNLAEPSPEASPELITQVSQAPATRPETLETAEPAAQAVDTTPQPTPRPTLRPTPTPRPVTTPRPTAAPTAIPKSAYRVQVGSYDSKDEAQSTLNLLSEKGYSAVVSENNGRYSIQLGVFDSQESAVALAEEVTNQGYAVLVRKVNR